MLVDVNNRGTGTATDDLVYFNSSTTSTAGCTAVTVTNDSGINLKLIINVTTFVNK